MIDTPVGRREGRLELAIDGGILTGSMTSGEHSAPIRDGRVDGERLNWSASIAQPMRLNLKFTAMVEGDRITGEARHLLGRAAFSGTRLP